MRRIGRSVATIVCDTEHLHYRGVSMTLFRLDSSIRTEGSVSREIADTVEAAWKQHHPDGQVVRRDVGLAPLPSDTWPTSCWMLRRS
jgi:hypothetical protein